MMKYKARILIVEDTRIIALSIKNDLEDLGYQVEGIIDNGDTAIEKVKNIDVDLILMDINIKGSIDGIETSRRILEIIDVPIIYLTAYTDDTTLQRAKKTSPYGYIIKPYEEKTLEITLDFALYKHQNEKQFKQIFNATHDGITITNFKGQIVDSNISSLKIFTDDNKNFREMLESFVCSSEMVSSYFNNLISNGGAEIELQSIERNITLSIRGTSFVYNSMDSFLHIIHDISHKKSVQRLLIANTFETEERNKQRFAEELHDGIGPLLSTSKTYLNTLADEKDPESQTEILDKLHEINDEIITNIKEISNDLRPHLLKNFGFDSALKTYIRKMEDAFPKISFHVENNYKNRFAEQVEVALFRIVSELINNSVKHAEPSQIQISLKKIDNLFIFEFSDNGLGFNISEGRYKGMGLSNIENRVNAIPGTLVMSSKPGKGFACLITLHESTLHTK